MTVKEKWSQCYRVIYCIKWYKLYSFRFADNFLSRDDPTMFTFIQVILMFCICFKISQGKIILWIHFTKSTISRYDSTFSPQHSRPTLWSIYYLGLQGGRICLSCNGVVKPRDCSTCCRLQNTWSEYEQLFLSIFFIFSSMKINKEFKQVLV